MRRHPTNIPLLNKCTFSLGSLSFQHEMNMQKIITYGGHTDCIAILESFLNDIEAKELLGNTMLVLHNVMGRSDNNRVCFFRGFGVFV